MRHSWSAAILAVGMVQTASAQGPLVLKQTIELSGVEGRFDHLAIDAARQRLFVAALGNDTVEVLDLAKGARTRSLSGFHEPQGIAALPELDQIAVANGESGDLVILDASDGSVKRKVPLSEDADNVRYDAVARRLYVAHGNGAIEISGDTDDLFFDAARKRLYISCGEGFLDVFGQRDAGQFTRIAKVPTASGARTSLYVPQQNRLYLAVPHRGSQKPEIRIYDVRD